MKPIALILFLLPHVCSASETISIEKVASNTTRTGLVLLDQGYSGTFSFAKGSYLVDDRDRKRFEFTNAQLNDQGIGNRSPKAQAIVVGIDSKKKETSYHSPSVYIERIPSASELMRTERVAEFEKVFGSFRSITDGWGSESEMHSSLNWMGFSLNGDESIRVVTVFLWTVNRGKGWEIEHRKIADGIFKPTGKHPMLEPE